MNTTWLVVLKGAWSSRAVQRVRKLLYLRSKAELDRRRNEDFLDSVRSGRTS